MKLAVNPNRMELLRLRKRLVLAERGHKLLKDKLEELMRRFLDLVRRLSELQDRIQPQLNKAFLSFAIARSRNSKEDIDRLLPSGHLAIETEKHKIFNLTVPRFRIKEFSVSDYDLRNTESELDIGFKKAQQLLNDWIEMAQLWKSVELLSNEIEATRRRVNALEHILIPNIKETIHYISGRLDEMERSFQVQLMRVKEIVRSH